MHLAKVHEAEVTPDGGLSAGTMALARKYIGAKAHPDVVVNEAFRPRLSMTWCGAVVKGGFDLATGYLMPGQGASATNVLILETWAAALATSGRP